jgi:hypothetical protein
MSTDTRTTKQIAADKLDLEMSRLADKLNVFGAGHSDRNIIEAGRIVDGLRSRVRNHMHPRDREETV